MDRDHWSRVAREWITWARKPHHDAFWAYRDAFVDFVGHGYGDALDVGCGEGRISRELTGCGYSVTACDPVAELLDAARQAGSAFALHCCFRSSPAVPRVCF
jgi:2-polyprenyl-3-methyl-5-hydroxy-6-metoxy-1,4-benzoquinol methylase